MAYKDKESEREYQKKHYIANKELYKERAKKSRIALRDRNREYVRSIKETNPCKDCGKFYHYSQMDFDHINDNKINGVARLTNTSLSIERIKSEIEKCELVCSNCHRFRTWQRLQS
jgi:hypothetical protein